MENQHPYAGSVSVLVSILGWITTLANVQAYISITAGCVGIISGIFAIMYYNEKTNEVRRRKTDD